MLPRSVCDVDSAMSGSTHDISATLDSIAAQLNVLAVGEITRC